MPKPSPSPPSTAPGFELDTGLLVAAGLVVLSTLFLLMKMMGGKKKFLDAEGAKKGKKLKVKLIKRTQLSHDTVRFRYELPSSAPILGLPVGMHFKLFCPNPKGSEAGKWNGREDPEDGVDVIERKYTPTTSDKEIGYVELVIKVYNAGHEKFCDGGKMSQYMDKQQVGDYLEINGPWGHIEYKGKGTFSLSKKPKQCKYIGMMSGGTGITPMLQIMAAVLRDPEDTTEMSLIYANQTEEDILVREELEALQKAHPKRLKLWYTVDRPPASGWKYSSGFITEDMIKEHLPPPGPDTLVLMCGPPPMVRFACKQNLDKLGYAKDAQVAF